MISLLPRFAFSIPVEHFYQAYQVMHRTFRHKFTISYSMSSCQTLPMSQMFFFHIFHQPWSRSCVFCCSVHHCFVCIFYSWSLPLNKNISVSLLFKIKFLRPIVERSYSAVGQASGTSSEFKMRKCVLSQPVNEKNFFPPNLRTSQFYRFWIDFFLLASF